MHRGDALEREVVVHHGEHTLLHLTAVPGVQDDLLTGGDVEGDAGVAAETELLEVLDAGLGGAVHHEIGLLGTDEHVGHEMGLPGDLHDEADLHAGVLVRAAETVHDEQALAAELVEGQLLDGLPDLLAHRVVVVRILGRSPPDFAGGTDLGGLVIDDVLVFRGTAGVDAGHHVDGAELGHLSLVETFETGFGFLIVKDFVRGVVQNLLHALDAILGQIDFCHNYTGLKFNSSILQIY